MEVEPTDSDNHFRSRFPAMHPGNKADQVVGTIQIAVNGSSDGACLYGFVPPGATLTYVTNV